MAWRISVLIAVVCLVPGAAVADGLCLPGLGLPGLGVSGDSGPRPSYRETYNDFPPPRGRYGGGIVEYVMTGGRSGLLPPPAPAYAVPVYAVPAYPPPAPAYAATAAMAMPRARLPDYAPDQPPAFYGGPQ